MADNIEGILVICIGFPLPRLVHDIDFFLAVGICYRYMKSEGIFLLSIYIYISMAHRYMLWPILRIQARKEQSWT